VSKLRQKLTKPWRFPSDVEIGSRLAALGARPGGTQIMTEQAKTLFAVRERRAIAPLLLGAAAIAALAAPALAQTGQTPPAQAQSNQTQSDQAQSPPAAADETIVVTGSRIPRPDYQFSNPVVSIDARSIQYSGVTNVTDLMERIPALVGSLNSANTAGAASPFIGGTGLNLLNLRNLGTERTLVLVNGRRHVSGLPGDSSVDTNTIPVDLIDRVDVLTGGASAIYGADGVSGVVNFIMKDNFQGLRTRVQGDWTEDGGGGSRFASVTAGGNFDNNRGNLAVALEYSHDMRLKSEDRDFSNHEVQFVRNVGDIPSPYDYVPLSNLRWYGSGPGGAVDTDFDFEPNFDGGTDAPWDFGAFGLGGLNEVYQQGGSGTPISNYFGDLLPDIKRFDVNVFGHYDITPTTRFFTEFKYVNTQSYSISQPSFDFFMLIDPDNYYLLQHPNIAADALSNTNAENFGLAPGSVLMTRDELDMGRRGEDITRQTLRSVMGLDGSLGAWGDWHASFTYGETDVRNVELDDRYNDRFAAAIDAVDDGSGNPVCRSNLDPSATPDNVFWEGWAPPTSFTPGPGSGCVPIDLFGNGSPSQAAINWITFNAVEKDKVTQAVATAYIDGNLDPWFTLPAGSLGYSLGAEYRRETSRSTPDFRDQEGITFGNAIPDSSGSFNVGEAFVEFSVPVLKDQPFAKSLSFDAADRFSHYSTIGNTNTWKVGGEWAPINDIRFRATHAIAVRAPNIGELFGPAGQDFEFITDPCDPSNWNKGTSFRAANCQALLTSLGVAVPSSFADINPNTNISGLLESNPHLHEEKATTNTYGFVLQPSFVPRFYVSVDYYDIDLQNAINTLNPQDIADQCVDLPTLNNQFCNAITRYDTATAPFPGDVGGIQTFVRQPVNVASYTTKGVDFSAQYSFSPSDAWGTFAFRLVGNYLDELTFVNLPGAAPNSDAGEQGAPKWQGTFDATWTHGPWTVNYTYQYFSETWRFATSSDTAPRPTVAPQFAKFSALSEHDVQVRYSPNEMWTLYVGGHNLGDQRPDLGSFSYPIGPEGRVFYVGFTASMN
jgi:outer membrane receptor protein involved in Fe transport